MSHLFDSMKPSLVAFLCFLTVAFASRAQESAPTQNVRGQVLDASSRLPMPGVAVYLLQNAAISTATDANGYFILTGVPLGRQSFGFSFMGYEPYTASEVPVIAGKELELNVQLKENLHELKEVKVSAGKDRVRPQNEFAQMSARSFSVEETRRYAASFADPARMVMNFPGVSSGGDANNGIVVRGNSPKGVLWRLEGIEIPNPNHFASLGATGGAISMLNANTLGNSDFYTGAFPAEIGNALSGAFDLSLRNGNADRREHTLQIGALGLEAATEGPFKKGSKASYLLNYRYSTLALLGGFLDLSGVTPDYQDASFKLHLPTRRLGTFGLFGLGGYNKANRSVVADSSEWDNEKKPNSAYTANSGMATGGMTHQIFLGKNAYIKTVVSGSFESSKSNSDTLNPADAYRRVATERSTLSNTAFRMSTYFNHKINARHTYRLGFIGQEMAYDFNYQYLDVVKKQWRQAFVSSGNTQFYQAYAQWKWRLNQQFTVTGGVHGSYLALNGRSSIEPRVTLAWEQGKNRYSLGAGLHSKPEHISTYLFTNNSNAQQYGLQPNKNLDLLRAFHLVGGYGTRFGKWRTKVEVYYQYLYNIPVGQDSGRSFSMLNADDMFSLLQNDKPLVSKGTGVNYGIDLSLERPFAEGFYMIATGSLYRATYTDFFGKEYNTRFNRGYQVNLIGGREYRLNSDGKRLIGINGKVLVSGSMRESQIDLAASRAAGEAIIVPNRYYTEQPSPYFRTDVGIYYKRNRRNATHTLQLDIQNVTNNKNVFTSYYDNKAGGIRTAYQMGFFPNISYRIDFHH